MGASALRDLEDGHGAPARCAEAEHGARLGSERVLLVAVRAVVEPPPSSLGSFRNLEKHGERHS